MRFYQPFTHDGYMEGSQDLSCAIQGETVSKNEEMAKAFVQDLFALEGADAATIQLRAGLKIAEYEKQVRDAQSLPAQKVTAVLEFRAVRGKVLSDELLRCENPKRKQVLQTVLTMLSAPASAAGR